MSNTNNRESDDFLTEDPEVPGQKFCLLSFLSPENVLKNKNMYFFNEFLNNFEVNLKSKLLEEFLAKSVIGINDSLEVSATDFEKQDLSGVATSCRNSKIRIDTLLESLHTFVKGKVSALNEDKLKEAYDDYMYTNSQKLEDQFYQKNEFHTTVRGLKVRGIYSSHEEAVSRSKKLQRMDTLHNIFVGEVGKWLPWDPEPSRVKEQEYAEEELNVLMKKYKENEDAREEFYRDKKNKPRQPVENTVGPSQTDSMFNAVGDLALERKMNK